MFKAVASYADFKRNMLAVSQVTEEALFVANSDGMLFYGMDASRTSLVLIDWPSIDFESYQCDDRVRIGAWMDTIVKIVKRLPTKTDIEIAVDVNMLILKSGSTQFKLRLLEVEETPREIPQFETAVEFAMDAEDFHTLVRDVEASADDIRFQVDGDKMSFYGRGEYGEVGIETDIVVLRGKAYKDGATSSYSIGYLGPFSNDMEGRMTLKFTESKPLILECGHAMFMLAPRVG